MTVPVVWKSLAISGMAGRNMVVLMGDRKHASDTMNKYNDFWRGEYLALGSEAVTVTVSFLGLVERDISTLLREVSKESLSKVSVKC